MFSVPHFPPNSGWYCVLSDQNEVIKILNISFPQVGIEPTTCHVYSRTYVLLRHDGLRVIFYIRQSIQYIMMKRKTN